MTATKEELDISYDEGYNNGVEEGIDSNRAEWITAVKKLKRIISETEGYLYYNTVNLEIDEAFEELIKEDK